MPLHLSHRFYLLHDVHAKARTKTSLIYSSKTIITILAIIWVLFVYYLSIWQWESIIILPTVVYTLYLVYPCTTVQSAIKIRRESNQNWICILIDHTLVLSGISMLCSGFMFPNLNFYGSWLFWGLADCPKFMAELMLS